MVGYVHGEMSGRNVQRNFFGGDVWGKCPRSHVFRHMTLYRLSGSKTVSVEVILLDITLCVIFVHIMLYFITWPELTEF